MQYKNQDALSFSKSLPDESVDLIITSPPYNLNKAYEKNINQSLEEYLHAFEPMIDEFVRILKPTGSICWQVGNHVNNGEIFPLDILFYPMFKKHGLRLRNRIIWHFGHGLHCAKRFSGRYETILWFTKTENYTFNLDPVRVPSKYPGKRHFKGEHRGEPSCNPKGKNPEDVWRLTVDRLIDDWDALIWDIPNVKSKHPEKTDHPCQFPIELAERCVLALTDSGDVVYDPFAGVGSSLLAALKNDREAYGTELNEEYIKIGLERIEQLEQGTLGYRPIYQTIYEPKPGEKVAQAPKEWGQNT